MKQYPDDLIRGFDRALRTLTGQHRANRPSPTQQLGENAKNTPTGCEGEPQVAELSSEEIRHAAGLMRVNHCGEVCAQALYDGQSATARSPEVLAVLTHSGEEEVDHLVWCEQRLDELGARPSVLNPLFYGASWALGVVTGLLGDRVSLAFVEATEEQVVKHLDRHLESLPEDDERSRVVVAQMREDEERHGHDALELAGTLGTSSGGSAAIPVEERTLSPLQKRVMAGVARLMTATTYRI